MMPNDYRVKCIPKHSVSLSFVTLKCIHWDLRLLLTLLLFAMLVTTIHLPNAFAYSIPVRAAPHPLFLDFLEYGFFLNSSQIFPNETIKNEVLNSDSMTQYNISSLEHELMGNMINATDVRVNVTPSAIDETKTRLDLEISAEQVNVTGSINRYYDNVQLRPLYGIYDSKTDLIEMHVPIDVALVYLGRT